MVFYTMLKLVWRILGDEVLVLVNDYNKDGSKIYNGLSPTKIKEGRFKYGEEIFVFGFLRNILVRNKIDFVLTPSKESLDKKWIYLMEHVGDPSTWLGTFSVEEQELYNLRSIDSLLSGVSDEVLKGVRKNNGIIILYGAYEGFEPLESKIFQSIDKELIEKKIPFDNFVYVTANQIADKLYDTWCKENNKKNKFNIICFNDEECYVFKDSNNLIYEFFNFSPEKYFLCFNRRPHVHRMFLASLLEKNNLVDKGMISFPDRTFSEGYAKTSELSHKLGLLVDSKSERGSEWKNKMKNVIRNWNKFEKRLPLLVDTETLDENLWFDFDMAPYKKTFFSVINETLICKDSIFVDEKIWKAITVKHPFIVVGTFGILRKLKEFGYKTFHPYINEGYDNIEDPEKRILAVVDEIKRLCSLSFDEWNDIINKLEPILEYNMRWKVKRNGGVTEFIDKLENLIDK